MSLNGARPLNSNSAPTKYKNFSLQQNLKKVATLLLFFPIGLLHPLELSYSQNFYPPLNVNLAPLIVILAPPEAFCTPNFFLRIDRTLSCTRYSRVFGIKTVNSGKMRPLRRRPSAKRTLRTWSLRPCPESTFKWHYTKKLNSHSRCKNEQQADFEVQLENIITITRY